MSSNGRYNDDKARDMTYDIGRRAITSSLRMLSTNGTAESYTSGRRKDSRSRSRSGRRRSSNTKGMETRRSPVERRRSRSRSERKRLRSRDDRRRNTTRQSSRSTRRRRRSRSNSASRRSYRRRRHGRSRTRSRSSRRRSRSRDRRRDRSRDRRRSGERRRKHFTEHEPKKKKKKEEKDESSGNYDDTVGHYEGQPGEWLNKNYKVLGEAGMGTFGRVLECWDQFHQRVVAMKVIRRIAKYAESAKIEAEILQDVNRKDPDSTSLCVRMFDSFQAQGHMCLVFERLGASLYDYIKKSDYRPFPITAVREFAFQLLHAVAFMHDMKLIHTDLKPENILLVSDAKAPWQSPIETQTLLKEKGVIAVAMDHSGAYAASGQAVDFRDASSGRLVCHPTLDNDIKLIDFGGATYDDQYKSTIVNTRQYRAPEVILGNGWSYASDLWSIGCIIGELYTGELLFATHENLEHLALMTRCVGPIPAHMILNASKAASKYFLHNMQLKFPMYAKDRESIRHVERMQTLKEIIHPADHKTGLLDLLERLLVIDPNERLSARAALCHPFFSGVYLSGRPIRVFGGGLGHRLFDG